MECKHSKTRNQGRCLTNLLIQNALLIEKGELICSDRYKKDMISYKYIFQLNSNVTRKDISSVAVISFIDLGSAASRLSILI